MATTTAAAAPALNAADFLRLDALLSDEERMIRDTVRAYVREQLLPNVAEWFEAGALPSRELARGLGELGLLGMHLHGYGCAGSSAVAYGLACLELEAGDSGLRSLVSVQGSLSMFAIWRFGSEEQKREWLPRMAAGEAIGCFGLTEPDAGSDPASMRTTAKRDGDDWVLNGTKMWITNGSLSDVAVVWARTYAGSRVQFGKPIAAFQLTQAKLAQMLLKVNQGALLALHLGRMKDAGKLRPEHVSFGKLENVNAALEVCREARQILGANGITLEYPVIRHMNNLESVVTYEGTAEVHSLVLGEAITGH